MNAIWYIFAWGVGLPVGNLVISIIASVLVYLGIPENGCYLIAGVGGGMYSFLYTVYGYRHIVRKLANDHEIKQLMREQEKENEL